MGPLAFVNWRSVNRRFCAFMWMVVLVLAVIVLMHVGHPQAAAHPHLSSLAH